MPIMKWGLSRTPPLPLESFVGVWGGEECCPAVSLSLGKGIFEAAPFPGALSR